MAFLWPATLACVPCLVVVGLILGPVDSLWMHGLFAFATISYPTQALLLSRGRIVAAHWMYGLSQLIVLGVAMAFTGGAASPFVGLLYLMAIMLAVLVTRPMFFRFLAGGAVMLIAMFPVTKALMGLPPAIYVVTNVAILTTAGWLLKSAMDRYQEEVAHSDRQRSALQRRVEHEEVLQAIGAIALRNDSIELLLAESCELLAYGLRADAAVARMPELAPMPVIGGAARQELEGLETALIACCDDVAEDPKRRWTSGSLRVAPLLRLGFRAGAGVVVRGGERRVGSVMLLFGAPRKLDADERALLNGVARILGLAVQRLSFEQERQQLSEQLRHAQKLEALGQLSAGIAHDFNNLMTVIVTGTSLARETVKEPDAAEDLDEVLHAAASATDLTRQLLAFSRPLPTSEVVAFDPNERLSATGRLLYRLLGDRVRLDLNLAPDPGRLVMDPSHFEQIIVNLAVNARDAMPEGGAFTLRTRGQHIKKETARLLRIAPGDYLLVEAQDTGTGMDPDVVDRVFEPFFTTKTGGRGTGLGLATVHGIVNQLGGSITIDTEKERGTTFRILLPAGDAHEETEPTSLRLISSASRRRSPARVLLVDDDPNIRAVLSRALTRRGYTVEQAAGAAQALACLAEREVDLVVTDVSMPEATGYDLAEQVKARYPGVPVLFISGESPSSAAAGQPFLAKPFTPETLDATLRDLNAAA